MTSRFLTFLYGSFVAVARPLTMNAQKVIEAAIFCLIFEKNLNLSEFDLGYL